MAMNGGRYRKRTVLLVRILPLGVPSKRFCGAWRACPQSFPSEYAALLCGYRPGVYSTL